MPSVPAFTLNRTVMQKKNERGKIIQINGPMPVTIINIVKTMAGYTSNTES